MKHPDTALGHHDRTEFQLERLILFTDAVFAIAITLLIIEIKVPELHAHELHSEADVLRATGALLPKFMGFFVAFFVIAVYWTAHHRVFRYVYAYDNRLIWLNLFFLLSIVLMPFTAAYQGEYPLLTTPWVLYGLSVIFTGLMQLRLQAYIRQPAHGITRPAHRGHPDLDLLRPLVPVSVFLLSIGVALLGFPWAARGVLLVIFPLMVLHGRRHRRLLSRHEAGVPMPPLVGKHKRQAAH